VTDPIPAEVFLAAYPDDIGSQADILRSLVRRAVPGVIERVRPGWRLIGYEIPVGRRPRYFAYVAPEPKHVHIGFEYGVLMADPHRLLEGAHLRLRKVRFLTFRPGQPIPATEVVELTREAARIAILSREERLALAADRDEAY
jgi:hypothetical protein